MIKKFKLWIGNMGVRLIKFVSRKAKIDLIRLAYWENGILKSHNLKASGEDYFISSFLPLKLKNPSPILFDVGANIGAYSRLLKSQFPNAELYSFEPNPNTFDSLRKKVDSSINLINKGIGEKEGFLDLYYSKDNHTSVQATSDPEILKVIAKTKEITSSRIEITTLDDFCDLHKIETIDFIKIDTEGFEMEALLGAKKLLERDAIKIIQFEFNEVNIVKRRFIRDFYMILPHFDFYRLDETRLIPLNEWQPIHEIFMFQNIVAVHK